MQILILIFNGQLVKRGVGRGRYNLLLLFLLIPPGPRTFKPSVMISMIEPGGWNRVQSNNPVNYTSAYIMRKEVESVDHVLTKGLCWPIK